MPDVGLGSVACTRTRGGWNARGPRGSRQLSLVVVASRWIACPRRVAGSGALQTWRGLGLTPQWRRGRALGGTCERGFASDRTWRTGPCAGRSSPRDSRDRWTGPLAKDLFTPLRGSSFVGDPLGELCQSRWVLRAEGGAPRFLRRETLERPNRVRVLPRRSLRGKGFRAPWAEMIVPVRSNPGQWPFPQPGVALAALSLTAALAALVAALVLLVADCAGGPEGSDPASLPSISRASRNARPTP